MKITSQAPPLASSLKPHAQSTKTSEVTPRTDESPVTSHLQEAAGLGSSIDAPFDQQRVAELRQAIAEGRFQIDARKIADSLLADVRDLLAKTGSGT